MTEFFTIPTYGGKKVVLEDDARLTGGSVGPTAVTVTANYTANAGDLVLANASTGSFTITLPAAAAAGASVMIRRVDQTPGNNVTIASGGADQFNPVVLQAGGEAVTFVKTAAAGTATWVSVSSAGGGRFRGTAYTAATNYQRGDIVSYNGILYQYISATAASGQTPSSAGSWAVLSFGANSITRVTANTSLGSGQYTTVDATSAPVTITLPSSNLFSGAQVGIKKVDASTNAVTISPGVNTYEAGAPTTLTVQGQSVTLAYDLAQTTWRVVSGSGTTGPAGTAGTAATVAVGTTTTGAAGSNASVTNSGTSSAAVFNFTIPQGATGPAGPAGTSGSSSYVSSAKWSTD